MWQNLFIQFSLKLQSNSNGGVFRYLTNANEILQIMLSSWLINIYFILLPIFTIFAIFLLIQYIKNWKFLYFPKFRYAIPVLIILSMITGTVVLVQLLEINNDVDKVQQKSEYYINAIQYQMYSSINSTKNSLIESLKNKKGEILPVVEHLLTDVVRIANNRSKSLNIDVFSKSDLILKVFDLANSYINSTKDIQQKQHNIGRQCNLRWIDMTTYCHEFPEECAQFKIGIKGIYEKMISRRSDNALYLMTFGTVFPMVQDIAKSYNVEEFLSTPAQYYDNGIDCINTMMEEVINTKLKAQVDKLLAKNVPILNESLTKMKYIGKVVIFLTILINALFLSGVLGISYANYRNESTPKKGRSLSWTATHFGMYLFGSLMLIIFVTGTSLLLNTQTEVCRYLADVSQSAEVADRYIDSFLDQHSRRLLEQNVPDKILKIPNLNLKNPRRILTTIMRQCPAQMILLPSLEMYRPINTTALIFSEFVEHDVLLPSVAKFNASIYENMDQILEVTNKILESKKHLLDILQVFPHIDTTASTSFLSSNLSLDTFRRVVLDDSILENISQKLGDDKPRLKSFKKVVLNRERRMFRECFSQLSDMRVWYENERLLTDIVASMSYFETLIRGVVITLQNVGDNINDRKERYFSDLLGALIVPVRKYLSDLILLLEEETLSKVIPCNELATFYSETVDGLCTSQLGNFLVLMTFGTLTFTLGSGLVLLVMMSY